MDECIKAIHSNDITFFHALLDGKSSHARRPQLVVEAARRAVREALGLLVSHGADLNASWRGYRPLHALIQEKAHGEARGPDAGRIKCLEWLLHNGADPEQLGAWPSARAVLIAAFAGVPEYVDCLLRRGAHSDAFLDCALGDVSRVRRELKQNPVFAVSRDSGGLTGLQCSAASRLGSSDPRRHRNILQIAALLLDAGGDLRARTQSWDHEVDAASLAVSAGNAELLELLISRGADATAALVAAVWQPDQQCAEICFRFGAELNRARNGDKPLLNQMVRWGRGQWVLWLLARGADPNLPDSRGWTAVHQAAARGNSRLFKAVVNAGGDYRFKDLAGKTPLDLANLKTREIR